MVYPLNSLQVLGQQYSLEVWHELYLQQKCKKLEGKDLVFDKSEKIYDFDGVY